jgi:hypothetical protein
MAVNYAASLKSTRMQAVPAAIDAAGIPGVIEIGTAGMSAVLVNIALALPSFNEVGGSISMNAVPRSGNAIAAGAVQRYDHAQSKWRSPKRCRHSQSAKTTPRRSPD